MANKLLILNMKMYMDIEDVYNYLKQIPRLPNNVIVCPEMIYIPYFLKNKYRLSLQNIYSINDGAYTGEVSARHAAKMGVEYTVIGHSERRIFFHETDEDINKKVRAALSNQLKVILCIGETLDDKDKLMTREKLLKQITISLDHITQINSDNLIIAYEPVWAIGTGKIPTNEDISKIVDFIKSIIHDRYNLKLKVVYGGSVNALNIKNLNQISNIDGFMIGGSSTKADEVQEIIKVVNG